MNELRLVSNYDNELALVTSAPIDREQSAILRLLLVCHDAGQPVLQSVQRLVIIVDDLNDNAPQFTQSVYNVSVVENRRAPVVCIHLSPRNCYRLCFPEPIRRLHVSSSSSSSCL